MQKKEQRVFTINELAFKQNLKNLDLLLATTAKADNKMSETINKLRIC